VTIIALLRELGAEVSYHDPHVPELAEVGLSDTGLEAGLDGVALTVIVTDHPEFDLGEVVEKSPLVLDLRGATRDIGADNVTLL